MYYSLINSMNRVLSSTDFIMTIDTTKAGSASNTFILPASTGTYDCVVDWDDGSSSIITSSSDIDLTHVYSVSGIYQIKITGRFDRIFFNNAGDRLKVLSIDNWGVLQFRSLAAGFKGCSNMDILATDTPDFSLCVSLGETFMGCSSLTTVNFANCDFSKCDTFYVGFARGCFQNCSSLNTVDFSNSLLRPGGVSMNYMFRGCGNFDLIGFDTLDLNYVNGFDNFLTSSTITTSQYNSLLIHMDSLDMINSLVFNGGTSKYTLASAAATARAGLISNDLWTITDGGGI